MLSYSETRSLIETVLREKVEHVRAIVHRDLVEMDSSEGELYSSIAKHGPSIRLTSEQWFELLSKLPNKIFWSQISIDRILSEEQMKRLPSPTG